MDYTDEMKKGACQCRSCKNVFQENETEHKYIQRNGQLVYESVCPYCGGNTYGVIDYPVSEVELLFSSKFYRDSEGNIEQIIEMELMNININNINEFVKYFVEQYDKNDDELVGYLTDDFGTCEWQAAFEYACNRSENEDLLAYCESLSWDEYDNFSCDIGKIIITNL